jgi:hypothetical protein
MGTLAGNKPAWGDDWGYDRTGHHYLGDATEILATREEGAQQELPPDWPALLLCVVFWLLIGSAVVLWWIS